MENMRREVSVLKKDSSRVKKKKIDIGKVESGGINKIEKIKIGRGEEVNELDEIVGKKEI